MTRIILIETSTDLCSAALTEDGRTVSYIESSEPRKHASLTAVYIGKILEDNGLEVRDCDAVCVSMGPGSYTGLRVGVSTAKGLCFGSGIPLLAIGTMDVLAWQAIGENLLPEGCRYIVPMIDARRMEAYTAVFDTTVQALAYYNESTVVDIAPAVRAELKIPEKPVTEAAAAAPAAK